MNLILRSEIVDSVAPLRLNRSHSPFMDSEGEKGNILLLEHSSLLTSCKLKINTTLEQQVKIAQDRQI